MKTMTKLIVCLFIGITNSSVYAQQSTLASGKTISNIDGNICYSVGQIFYTTNSNSTATISQGVQQSFEIFLLGTHDFQDISLKMLLYPNPTKELVTLRIENMFSNSLEYHLLDENGKEILNNKIDNVETYIQFNNLPVATYFFNVSDKNKIVKSFKIIKTN